LFIPSRRSAQKLGEKAGLSRLEWAEKSDSHLNDMGGIERGIQNPSCLKLIQIAKS
jgi:hypothetical protein